MSAPAFKRPESVLVVVHTDDRILLMERCSPPGFWQSVTGSLRDGESSLQCAIRELAEETGFEAAGLRDLQETRRFRIAPEWRHRYAPGVKENVEHAFALRLPRALAPRLNPAEHRAHRWMPVAEALAAATSWTDRAAIRSALGLPEAAGCPGTGPEIRREGQVTGTQNSPPIVTVHGLWNHGPEAWLLRRRLARLTGRTVAQFRYPSVTADFSVNARRLAAFLEQQDGPADAVGHSLGGLLVMEAIRRVSPGTVRRVVLLAAPVRGSATARRFLAWPRGGGRIIGRSAPMLGKGVDLTVPEGVEVGMIAGSRAVGVGKMVGAMSGVHDGTVELEETRFEGLSDHVVLPVTHTGMLFSDEVARAAADFLRDGRFGRYPTA